MSPTAEAVRKAFDEWGKMPSSELLPGRMEVLFVDVVEDWLRLQENSRPIWWCQQHEWPALMSTYCGRPVPEDCRMVERRMI